ncbi:MAG: alpha/beta fold hydrolase [Caldilineae bacterium]|nr:MAG: alpha/beta fold hydrolase [Caldilineae bacterium]
MLPPCSLLNPASYYLRRPDVRIHYRRLGAGPPLLLLHGLGSCADDWFPVAPGLAAAFELILVDVRGHGHSSLASSRDYAIARMAEDVLAVMDALDIGRAHVLGLSLGGCVALQLAVSYPRRVDRLVLVNTFARLRNSGLATLRHRLSRLYACARDMDVLAEFVAASLFDDPEIRAFAAERLRRNDRGCIVRTMLAIARFNLLPHLQRVHHPALVLVGARDRTVPRECAWDMMARLPRAWLRVIPDAGHALPFDQPERFYDAVSRFLLGQDNTNTRASKLTPAPMSQPTTTSPR